MPRFSKFHRFTTREERGTQDEVSRAPSTRRCPTYVRSQHLKEIAALAPLRQSSARKISGIKFYFSKVNTPRRISSQILVMRFLHFLHAPTQISSIWRRALVVAIPKPNKILGGQRSFCPVYYCVSPSRSLKDSSTLLSNQLLIR